MPIERSTEASSRRKAALWTVAIGYVLFIYATLGVVPAPLKYLRSHGALRLTLGALFTLCLAGLFTLLAQRSRQVWRFIALALLAGAYALIAHHVVVTPEEQIHFIQYGLVGVLFVRAVRPSTANEAVAYASALVLAILAGWVDELFQGLLPNRHYDVRDIWLNSVSALLGLVVYRLIPRKTVVLTVLS